MKLPVVHDPPPPDGCGTCTVCCDVEGVPALGKPFYARCPHLIIGLTTGGCGIYEQRPEECRRYRCAWHLGWLGSRVERRPDHSGLLVTLRPEGHQWSIDVLETRAGAATSERVRALVRMILASRKTRHLSFARTVSITPYGADVAVDFEVSKQYDYEPPGEGDVPVMRELELATFAGKIRGLLMPTRTQPTP